jgi:hypothetical protein
MPRFIFIDLLGNNNDMRINIEYITTLKGTEEGGTMIGIVGRDPIYSTNDIDQIEHWIMEAQK